MLELIKNGVFLYDGTTIVEDENLSYEELNNKIKSTGKEPVEKELLDKNNAKKGTIAYHILNKHNASGNDTDLAIKFDALASHDITYVGIVQTAIASGLTAFPVPYVLTNCHNSLCSVGGTINEDDHVFGLSAAKKFGGIFVPPHVAVIHQYMREMHAACGSMILGSDSHTRYGALGTMAIGEGGPEIVKQLLSNTYDVKYPEVVLVYLEGTPRSGIGPQDVALAIVGAVFKDGFAKNKVLEFVGPAISSLSVDFRNGIDVMTTETSCLTSIWSTDEKVEQYLEIHGRKQDYKKLDPAKIAYYDSAIKIDLSKVECMIALPFHPSNVYSIKELSNNALDIFNIIREDGKKQFNNSKIDINLSNKIIDGKHIQIDQGIVAGCSGGTFENIYEMSMMLENKNLGSDYFSLSVYPASQPVNIELTKSGAIQKLMEAGAIVKTAFCGPCFGAGDVPANNALSIRHTTRNFPNREGSKPNEGQISYVALMDTRSIAATALNGGILTPATEIEIPKYTYDYAFNGEIYNRRVHFGHKKANDTLDLKFGPNIAEWPKMYPLNENVLLSLASVIHDEVTTTDELIPSGETSSFRSNPLRLAQFTLSRKDPEYVGRTTKIHEIETNRLAGEKNNDIISILSKVSSEDASELLNKTSIGSAIFARKPGDGSAREQAASCQKVLGGYANIAYEYATKRYRSNLINWGILPFTFDTAQNFDYENGDYIFVPNIKNAVENGIEEIPAKIITKDAVKDITLYLKGLNETEKEILLQGSLINYYASKK